MEPLSQIFESLKRSSDTNKIRTSKKIEKKNESRNVVLTKRLSSLKEDRLKRVNEALIAKKEENTKNKNIDECSGIKNLKRSISVSRKLESMSKRFEAKELSRNSRLESILSSAHKNDSKKCIDDSNDKDKRDREEVLHHNNIKRRESFNKSSYLRRSESIDRDDCEGRNCERRGSVCRRSESDRCDDRRECGLRRRESNIRCRESSLDDISYAEDRFLRDLDDGRYEESIRRRRYRR